MGLYRVSQGLCALAILLIAANNILQMHVHHSPHDHFETAERAANENNYNGRRAIAVIQQEQSFNDKNHSAADRLMAIGIKPRAFTWNRTVPCYKPDPLMKKRLGYRQPSRDGIIFIKMIKTGGSTATGITMRIAKHTAERNKERFWICRGRWDHNFAFRMLADRERSRSFTWTVVRSPTKRAVSDFFHFAVSREGLPSTDSSFQQYLLDKNKMKNLYLRLLSLEKLPWVGSTSQYNISTASKLINQIMGDYDFIGVTERMDESAVALAMILNVPLGDVLYLNAKASGGYDDGVYRNKCQLIQKSFVSDGMQAFFKSEAWLRTIRWDEALHVAANISLDMTIEKLGKDNFERNLLRFREAQQAAKDQCSNNDTFPCRSNGQANKDTQCLWSDSGCGYPCLNRIAKDFNIG